MNIPVVFLLFLLALVTDGTVSDAGLSITSESGQSAVQRHEVPIPAPVPEAVWATLPESKPSIPASNPPVIAIPIDWLNNVFYSIIGLLLLAGIAWLLLQWKKLPKIDPLENKDLISQTSQNVRCQKNTLNLDLPFGIFSNEWLEKVSPEKLTEFIDQAKTAAVDAFFREIGDSKAVPTPAQIKAAQEKMAQELGARISTTGTFEMLYGDKRLDDKIVNYLRQNETLLPAIRVPEPVTFLEDINRFILCCVVFAGTIIGFILGGMIGRWGMGLSPDAGLIFGGALGAPLTLAGCLLLANNPQLKKWVIGIVAGLTLVDFTLQYFQAAIPLPIWIKGKSGWTGFLKRLLLYLAVIVLTLIIKRDLTFDRSQYRETLDAFAEQWLRSALPIFAVLMFRYKDETRIIEHTDLTNKLFQRTCDLRTKTGGPSETGIKMLEQEFVSAGYNFPPMDRTLIWNESMSDRYTTFGLIESGTEVTIQKFPVIQDGKVIEKGMASD